MMVRARRAIPVAAALLFISCGDSTPASGATPQPYLALESGGHTSRCNWLGFSSDGTELFSLGNDKVIRIWDVAHPEAPRLDRSLRLPVGPGPQGMLYAGALSPDDRWLAVGGYATKGHLGHVFVFDRSSGKVHRVLIEPRNVIMDLAWSASGQYLAAASADQTLRVWDLGTREDQGATLEELGVETAATLKLHTGTVNAVAFLPNSQPPKCVSAGDDSLAVVWERRDATTEWTCTAEMRHRTEVEDVACSPNGKWIATSERNGTIRLWEPSGKLVATYDKERGGVWQICFPSDDVLLGSGGPEHALRKWSLPDLEVHASTNAHQGKTSTIAVSPDGRIAAGAGGPTHDIVLWDTASIEARAQITGLGAPISSVAFSVDGRGFTYQHEKTDAGGPAARYFDLETMAAHPASPAAEGWIGPKQKTPWQSADVSPIEPKTLLIQKAGTKGVQISRRQDSDEIKAWTFLGDGQRIAVGSAYGLTLHDAATGEQKHKYVGHTGPITCLVESPDQKYLLSGSSDQTVRLWSLRSTEETQTPLLSFFFTADGAWVAWTDWGYYQSSPRGAEFFGWHLNQGAHEEANYAPSWQLRSAFCHPKLLQLTLATGSIASAVALYQPEVHARQAAEATAARPPEQAHPPSVLVHAPRSGAIVPSRSVAITADIAPFVSLDDASEIFVRILVNGRPVAGWEKHAITVAEQPITAAEQRGPATSTARDVGIARRHAITAEVPLEHGKNTISIVASTPQEDGEPARVEVTSTAENLAPHEQRPDLYVLAVGVSDYHDAGVTDLSFADDDARGLAQAFRSQDGKAFRSVHAYTPPDQASDALLVNETATRRNILHGIRWLRQSVTNVDLAVVCVSGHGSRDAFGSYYFLPYDYETGDLEATGIHWTEFIDSLGRLPCRVLLLMDTCHAASVTGAKRSTQDRAAEQESWEHSLKIISNRQELYVISAALPAQKAMESNSWGHGALALALIEGITGERLYQPRAATPLPIPQGGFVRLPAIHTYAARRVKELTEGDQHAAAAPRDLPPIKIAYRR